METVVGGLLAFDLPQDAFEPAEDAGTKRLAAAADAAWRAGRPEAAADLIVETLARVGEGRLRAEVLRLHGGMEFFAGKGDTAASAFLEAVSLLEEADKGGAVAAAADAVNALIRVRQPAKALETAQKARSLAPEDGGGGRGGDDRARIRALLRGSLQRGGAAPASRG